MKKLILLLFIPLVSFGQTENWRDSIMKEKIKKTVSEWDLSEENIKKRINGEFNKLPKKKLREIKDISSDDGIGLRVFIKGKRYRYNPTPNELLISDSIYNDNVFDQKIKEVLRNIKNNSENIEETICENTSIIIEFLKYYKMIFYKNPKYYAIPTPRERAFIFKYDNKFDFSTKEGYNIILSPKLNSNGLIWKAIKSPSIIEYKAEMLFLDEFMRNNLDYFRKFAVASEKHRLGKAPVSIKIE